MICPICMEAKILVDQTFERGGVIYRRRKCSDPDCGAIIYTEEREAVTPEDEERIKKQIQSHYYEYDLKRAMRGGDKA